MASLRFSSSAVSADLLADEDIRRVEVPSVVLMFASCVTNGDTLGLRLDRTIIRETGEVNIESSADVVDTSRDQVVFGTVVGRGNLRLPVGAVTTEIQGELSVEPIL